MSYKVHRVQNKQKRETNEIRTSELYDLRRKNQQLARENSRLKKELRKVDLSPVDEVEESLGEKDKTNGNHCPKCNAPGLTSIPFANRIIIGCKECLWRKTS